MVGLGGRGKRVGRLGGAGMWDVGTVEAKSAVGFAKPDEFVIGNGWRADFTGNEIGNLGGGGGKVTRVVVVGGCCWGCDIESTGTTR